MTFRNIFKISLVLVSLCLIFLLGIQLFTKYYLNDKLKAVLKEAALHAEGGPFQLKIEELNTSLFQRNILLRNLEMVSERDSGKLRMIKAGSISISGIQLYKLIHDKVFHATSAIVLNAEIMMNNEGTSPEKKSNEKAKNFIQDIFFDTVSFTNTSYSIYHSRELLPYGGFQKSGFNFYGFHIANKDGVMKIEHGFSEATLREVQYATSNGFYRLSIPEITISETNHSLSADTVVFVPNYGEKEFFKRSMTQTDRFVFSTGFHLAGFKIEQCMREGVIQGQTLQLDRLIVEAYRNKKYPRDHERKKSLQQILKDLPFALYIDTVLVKNGSVEYKEMPEEGDTAGVLKFDGLYATITGLRNDSLGKTLTIDSRANLAGKSRLNILIKIPLNTTEMQFSCYGNGGKSDLTDLNPVIEKLTPIHIKQGRIDSIQFAFTANDKRATGTMEFAYTDLKVELQNKNNEKTPFNDAAGFLAHLLIVRENNPGKSGVFRTSEINYERDPEKFMINYSWKAIQSGIMHATGFGNDKIAKR